MHLPASKDGTSLDTRKADATTPASPSAPREKPQKVLPCPRCESMNTKFCYYNNYSVNQPRHFCRQCQRYWTVGGTLRNVPVGGGSRKKNRHQRSSDPYLRTGATTTTTTATGGPLALATSTIHDMPAFNFSQLSGFNPHPFYPFMQPDHQTMVPGMYINPLTTKSGEFQPMFAQPGAPSLYPNLAQLQPEAHVKPEFWTGNNHQVWEQTPPKQEEQVKPNESSMLLHLGLNSSNRPHHGKPAAAWNMNNQVTGTSPPHGSSTIEEEGSTPTNGYSNSGYEEGDTVSSMWQEMQEMQDIFQ